MEKRRQRLLAAEFKRKRVLRMLDPFCVVCGEDNPWADYEEHHIDSRRWSDDCVLTCRKCHVEVHVLLRTFDPIPPHVPKSRRRIIHVVRGQIALQEALMKRLGDIEAWLLSELVLPAAANDDDDDGGLPDDDVALEAVERKFGLEPEGDR